MSLRTWLNKGSLWLVVAIYGVYALHITVHAIQNPFRNWDMIAYVGTALSWVEPDETRLYERMKEDVRVSVPDWLYNDYYFKNTMADNPRAFYQQLPFYDIKILYPALMWVFHSFGMTFSEASWVISALCFAGMMVALALWRPLTLDYRLWLLSVIALCEFGQWPMATLARFSTPDALYTLLLACSLLALSSRKPVLYSALIGIAAILARPDALFTAAAVTTAAAGWEVLRDRDEWRKWLAQWGLSLLAMLLAYGVLRWSIGGYGWAEFFHYYYVKVPYPLDLDVHIDFNQYWSLLQGGIGGLLASSRVQCFIVLSIAACIAGFFYWRDAGKPLLLLLVTLAVFIVRYPIYPFWEDRYFFGYCILLLAPSLDLIARWSSVLWLDVQRYRTRINAS